MRWLCCIERAGTEVTDWSALSAGRPYEWAIEAWSLFKLINPQTEGNRYLVSDIQEILGIILLRAVVLKGLSERM